jgi:hypothetical protein
MELSWSAAVAVSGNQRQIGTPRKQPKQAKTVATGCDQLPIGAKGKEEVTRVHARSLATQFLLQIGMNEISMMRREASRVSFPMCPFVSALRRLNRQRNGTVRRAVASI